MSMVAIMRYYGDENKRAVGSISEAHSDDHEKELLSADGLNGFAQNLGHPPIPTR